LYSDLEQEQKQKQKQLQQVALHEYRADSGGPPSQLWKRRPPLCHARPVAARRLLVPPGAVVAGGPLPQWRR